MKAVKKYWWVFLLVAVLLFFFFGTKMASDKKKKKEEEGETDSKGSKGGGCKQISWQDFKGKKQYYYDTNGGDWTRAHLQVLDEGYCEHSGT